MLFPYINAMAVSLNDGNDTALGGITVYPRVFTLENYITIFKSSDISNALNISLARVALGTLLSVAVTVFAAYALTKKQMPGRSQILTFLIIPMFIGGGIIPAYILFNKLNLLNNFLIYILPGAFNFFNMIVVRTYLYTIPQSLEEAAIIDGANEPQVLFKIILPLAKPVLATIVLWCAVGHWNDWVTSLMFITKKNLFPLQFIMMKLVKESELLQRLASENAMRGIKLENVVKITPDSVKAATLIVTTLPIVLLYPFLQRYFVQGVVIGAVKD